MSNLTKHRSVSQMATYTSCPKKYKYSYLDKLNIMTDSSAKTFGLALHKAQEFNYRQKIKSGKDLPLNLIKDFMCEYLITEFKNNKDNPNFFKIKYGKKETGENILQSAKNCLALLHKEIFPTIQPLYVELPITLKISGQEFLLYIDVIDKDWKIRDLKTSAQKYSEDSIEYNTQLIAYALAVRTKFKRQETSVVLDVIVKTKTPQTQILETEVSDARILRFLNSLEDINKGIENAVFPPVDNQMTCSWCQFKDVCLEDGNLPDAKVLAEKLKNIHESKFNHKHK